MIVVADFLGGPSRGDDYRKPFQVKVSLIDYLIFKLFGANSFLNRVNKNYNQTLNEDYFGGVRICRKI